MNNDSKLVTLAILTYSKAQILQTILENEGIESYIQNVNLIQPVIINGWLSSSSCFLVTTEALLNQKEPKNGKELDGGKADSFLFS